MYRVPGFTRLKMSSQVPTVKRLLSIRDQPINMYKNSFSYCQFCVATQNIIKYFLFTKSLFQWLKNLNYEFCASVFHNLKLVSPHRTSEKVYQTYILLPTSKLIRFCFSSYFVTFFNNFYVHENLNAILQQEVTN